MTMKKCGWVNAVTCGANLGMCVFLVFRGDPVAFLSFGVALLCGFVSWWCFDEARYD